jgi:DNA-directed RNA polymerase specialized sigma24 family protein
MLDFLRSFPYFKNGVAFKREDEDLLSSEPVTCEEIKRVEARVDLEKLIGPLPDQQRQVILAVMYGVAQHSIASMLKITAGRVSQIKNESLASLRWRLAAGRADGMRSPVRDGSNRLARTPVRQQSVAQQWCQ